MKNINKKLIERYFVEKKPKIGLLEDRILELIDNRDEFTRSDLQALVTAIVYDIVKEAK